MAVHRFRAQKHDTPSATPCQKTGCVMSVPDGNYILIPTAVTEMPISNLAKLVYGVLQWRDGKLGCFPLVSSIAATLNKGESTIRRALDELRAEGLIDWWRGPKTNNHYKLMGDRQEVSSPDRQEVSSQTASDLAVRPPTFERSKRTSRRTAIGAAAPVASGADTGRPDPEPALGNRPGDKELFEQFLAEHGHEFQKHEHRKRWTAFEAWVAERESAQEGAVA